MRLQKRAHTSTLFSSQGPCVRLPISSQRWRSNTAPCHFAAPVWACYIKFDYSMSLLHATIKISIAIKFIKCTIHHRASFGTIVSNETISKSERASEINKAYIMQAYQAFYQSVIIQTSIIKPLQAFHSKILSTFAGFERLFTIKINCNL